MINYDVLELDTFHHYFFAILIYEIVSHFKNLIQLTYKYFTSLHYINEDNEVCLPIQLTKYIINCKNIEPSQNIIWI